MERKDQLTRKNYKNCYLLYVLLLNISGLILQDHCCIIASKIADEVFVIRLDNPIEKYNI